MYLLFLDESGTPPSREKAEGKFFVIGGIAINDRSLNQVYISFENIKKRFNVKGEIKWKFFGKKTIAEENSLSHLSLTQRDKLREDIFKLIGELSFFAICSDVYNLYDNNKNISVEEIYYSTYEQCFCIYENFLIEKDETGIISIDPRLNVKDEKLRLKHHELIKFDKNNGIINSLSFIPSHLSVGIQLADMIAGATYRKYQFNDPYFIDKLLLNFSG